MELDLAKIEETPYLLDILLELEDVMDSLDIYVFRHWLNGQVVDGPTIRRYWVSIVLRFPLEEMPDPRAGLRMLAHGIMVEYKKEPLPNASLRGDNEMVEEDVWHVYLKFPRKLINGMNDSGVDFYEDEVDMDDFNSAKDMGVDATTEFQTQDSKQ